MAFISFPNSTSTSQQVGDTTQALTLKLLTQQLRDAFHDLIAPQKLSFLTLAHRGFASEDIFKRHTNTQLREKNVLGKFSDFFNMSTIFSYLHWKIPLCNIRIKGKITLTLQISNYSSPHFLANMRTHIEMFRKGCEGNAESFEMKFP